MALGSRSLAICARQEPDLRIAPIGQEFRDPPGDIHSILHVENHLYMSLPQTVAHAPSLLLYYTMLPNSSTASKSVWQDSYFSSNCQDIVVIWVRSVLRLFSEGL